MKDQAGNDELVLKAITYEMEASQKLWNRIFSPLDELLDKTEKLLKQLEEPWDELISSQSVYLELKRQLYAEIGVLNLFLMSRGFLAEEGEAPLIPGRILTTYLELTKHLAQIESRYESFPWPSTDAPLGNGDSDADWTEKVPKVGMLKHMGYKVGEQGLGQSDRQKILREVFKSPLPLVKSREYTAQWGNPSSSQRLQKLAKTLASLCRQFKRNDASSWADYTCAIEEYEDDLDWLYHTYYKGRFDFSWPETYNEDYD